MIKWYHYNMRKVILIGILLLSLILLSIGIYGIYTFFYVASNPIIESVTLEEDDKIHIKYSLDSNNRKNKIYYIYKNENIIPDVMINGF